MLQYEGREVKPLPHLAEEVLRIQSGDGFTVQQSPFSPPPPSSIDERRTLLRFSLAFAFLLWGWMKEDVVHLFGGITFLLFLECVRRPSPLNSTLESDWIGFGGKVA